MWGRVGQREQDGHSLLGLSCVSCLPHPGSASSCPGPWFPWFRTPLIPLMSQWLVAPSPSHSSGQVQSVFPMGTNEKFTARKPLCQVAPSPAPCPAPRPSLSGSEFTETSQVSDSHLPFLLRRDGPNPHALEPGTCLPGGWHAVGERGSPGGKPEQSIPLRSHLPSRHCLLDEQAVPLASCHLRGEPGRER